MSLGHGASIVRNGLVLHLDAANPKSYPGSGTTWKDLSGNGNHLNIQGAPTHASGAFAISGSNTTDYFIKNPFSHPTTALTVEIWCMSNVGSSGDALWSYAVTGDDNHELLFDQSNLALYGPALPSGLPTSITVADGKWKQITRTSLRSPGTEILYVNGVAVYSATISAGTNFTSGGSLVLGQEQDAVGGMFDAAQSFSGKYAAFRMYNRALSATEVKQNFEALRGRYGI